MQHNSNKNEKTDTDFEKIRYKKPTSHCCSVGVISLLEAKFVNKLKFFSSHDDEVTTKEQGGNLCHCQSGLVRCYSGTLHDKP